MRGLLWRTKGRLATARMVARWPGAHLESTTVSGLAVRRNVGLGSLTNSQPGRLRYVAQASGLRVLAAVSRARRTVNNFLFPSRAFCASNYLAKQRARVQVPAVRPLGRGV